MVEFALVIPLLLLLVFGIIAFAHLFFVYIISISAGREAARYGVAIGDTAAGIPRYQDCAGIRAAARRVGAVIGLVDSDIVIEYDTGPGTAVFATCPVGGVGPNLDLGERIVIRVTTTYTPFIPLVALPSYTFSTSSSRTVVKDIYVGAAPPLTGLNTATSEPDPGSTPEPPPTATTEGGPPAPEATATTATTPTVTATAVYCTGAGTVVRQQWNGISGFSLADLYDSKKSSYPNNPDSTSTLTSMDSPINVGNNYGARIYGWLCPPITGSYTFWVSSNNEGELRLSTNSSSASAARIAHDPDWSNRYEWTKFAAQQSVPITLQAGQLYYIEAVQKEGGGDDNLAVAWSGPGISGPVVISGIYLKPSYP